MTFKMANNQQSTILSILDNFSKNFIINNSEDNGIELLRFLRNNKHHYTGILIGKMMEKNYPFSRIIKDELGILYYYSENYNRAYDAFGRALSLNVTEEKAKHLLFNQNFTLKYIKDRYNFYNQEKVKEITEKINEGTTLPLITLTMTSCKRLDLFTQTVNSFINCCLDTHLISDWICVDDNSSDEDRQKMQELYPFFKFYFKNKDEKGHPRSMNIIKKLVNTPYFFHMEDDFKFYAKRKYLTECLEILAEDKKYGQCLINKNYAEVPNNIHTLGGDFRKTRNNLRYYIHEHVKTDEDMKKWTEKHGNGSHCNYWPHYSFRPSLTRTRILHEIGDFNEKISHFEMEYSYRYENSGYLSTFLEGIYCMHIGRLTSERNDPTKSNAYELNGEKQFSNKEHILKIKNLVINLDRRQDRLQIFAEKAKSENIEFTKFSAIDGKKLKSTGQLNIIFENNDYNMRKGIVGAAMSHIKLCIELINDEDYDAYCIFEDDIEFSPNFNKKYLNVLDQLVGKQWDIVYLGHSLREQYKNGKEYIDFEKMPVIEKWDRNTSLVKSMGGAFGYIINKMAAIKLLEYINLTGMTNAIDTMQQKMADSCNIYYCYPHIVYTECWGINNQIDTDIQVVYDSLTLSYEDRLNLELEYYNNTELGIDKIEDIQQTINLSIDSNRIKPYYHENDQENFYSGLKQIIVHPYYILSNRAIIVVPRGNTDKYFHRFKKANNWNIDEALEYYE